MLASILPALAALVCGQPVQLQGAIQQQTLSLPSIERLFGGLNPGAELGVELGLWAGQHVRLVQGAGLGFFHHRGYATSLTLRTATTLRFEPIESLELDLGLSVGYLAHLPEADLFRGDADGFARVRTPWLHRFVGGPGVAVGWRFGPFTPFIAYHVLVEAPFMERLSPIIPRQLLQLGLRWRLAPEVEES